MKVDAETTTTPGRSRLNAAIAAAVVLAATAASVPLYGYAIGLHNHSIQLPYLRWLQDRSLYPHDALIESMRGYFSLFWPAMAAITRVLPLDATFFVGHLLTLAATYAAVFALGRRAGGRDVRAGCIAVVLVLFGDSIVGEESLHWFYFSHTPVATAIGLWALAAALSGRWLLAFALGGVVFDVHAMQGGYVALMLVAASVVGGRIQWKTLVLGVCAFALIASPALWWMLRSAAVGGSDNLAPLLRAYFPQHFFASSFSPDEWVGLAALVLLFFAAWWTAPKDAATKRIAIMALSLIALGAIGGALDEWRPIALVLKLHVFRASTYFAVLTLMLLSAGLTRIWQERGSAFIPPAIVVAMIAALAMAGLPRWLVVAALLPPLVAARRGGTAHIVASVVGGAMLFAFWKYDWLVRFEAMPILDYRSVARPVLIGFLAVAVGPFFKSGWRGIVVLTALIAFGWLAVDAQRSRAAEVQQRIAAYDAWFDVQRWVRDHSSPDDLMLTPPDCEGFRVFSERPVVGEWKDGAAILWDRDFAGDWTAWYASVGGQLPPASDAKIWERLARAWYSREQADIEQMARTAGAKYIVLRKPTPPERAAGLKLRWTGPVLYENARFLVVAVEPTGVACRT